MGNFSGKEEEAAAAAAGNMGQMHEPHQPPSVDVAGHGARGSMDFDPVVGDATEELVPTVFKWEHGGRQVMCKGVKEGLALSLSLYFEFALSSLLLGLHHRNI